MFTILVMDIRLENVCVLMPHKRFVRLVLRCVLRRWFVSAQVCWAYCAAEDEEFEFFGTQYGEEVGRKVRSLASPSSHLRGVMPSYPSAAPGRKGSQHRHRFSTSVVLEERPMCAPHRTAPPTHDL